jgi:hypothetical protein
LVSLVIYSVKGGREPDRKMAILKIDFTYYY